MLLGVCTRGITVHVVDMPLTQRHALHVCEYLVRFDCCTLRRFAYKSLQGHIVITLFGECFFIRTHVVTTSPQA